MVLIIHFGNIVFWSAAPTATRQPRTCRVSEAHMSSPNPTWLPRLDTQKVSEWRPMMKSFCNVHDIIPSHFFRITSDWLRMLGRRNLAWTAEVARRPASWPKPWGIFLYVSRQYLCFCFHQSTYHYTTTACILALQGWRHRGNLRHPPTSSRLRPDQHAAGQGPDVERILVQPVCVCVCVCVPFFCAASAIWKGTGLQICIWWDGWMMNAYINGHRCRQLPRERVRGRKGRHDRGRERVGKRWHSDQLCLGETSLSFLVVFCCLDFV